MNKIRYISYLKKLSLFGQEISLGGVREIKDGLFYFDFF